MLHLCITLQVEQYQFYNVIILAIKTRLIAPNVTSIVLGRMGYVCLRHIRPLYSIFSRRRKYYIKFIIPVHIVQLPLKGCK
jgi:hypothetical protein